MNLPQAPGLVLVRTHDEGSFEAALVHVATYVDGTVYGVCRPPEELESNLAYGTSWYVKFSKYASGEWRTTEVTLEDLVLDPVLDKFLAGLPTAPN